MKGLNLISSFLRGKYSFTVGIVTFEAVFRVVVLSACQRAAGKQQSKAN